MILAPRLLGLAEDVKIILTRPEKFAKEFLNGVRANRGKVVAYSTAEKNTLISLFPDEQDLLSGVYYLNLAKAARSWIQKYKQKEFDALPPLVKTANEFSGKRHPRSLASVCRLIGFNAPADYAIGRTTSRFNAVIDALEKRKHDYRQLTPVQKAKATKVLKHHRYDIKSMIELFRVINEHDPKIIKTATSPLVSHISADGTT